MATDYEKQLEELRRNIKSFPDFPKKGILFWDIFSALADGHLCRLLQSVLIQTIRAKYPEVEAVVGLESRGFLFGFSLAAELGVSFLPIRKKGKLPGDCESFEYDLEYGSDVVEVQKAAVKPGLKCVLIDDLMATGGTLAAANALLKKCGAKVIGALVIIELTTLKGRQNIPDVTMHSLLKYD